MVSRMQRKLWYLEISHEALPALNTKCGEPSMQHLPVSKTFFKAAQYFISKTAKVAA